MKKWEASDCLGKRERTWGPVWDLDNRKSLSSQGNPQHKNMPHSVIKDDRKPSENFFLVLIKYYFLQMWNINKNLKGKTYKKVHLEKRCSVFIPSISFPPHLPLQVTNCDCFWLSFPWFFSEKRHIPSWKLLHISSWKSACFSKIIAQYSIVWLYHSLFIQFPMYRHLFPKLCNYK